MNPQLFGSGLMQPMQQPLTPAAPQVPLNPMLLLEGLKGMDLAGNPGTNPLVAQGLSQYQGNPATMAAMQRRG